MKYNTQHNDIQHNDIQHYDIQHNNTQHNDTQHNNTQLNDIQHYDSQHDDIQHNDTQHNHTQHNDIQHYDSQHDDIQHNNIQHNDIQHNDNGTQYNVSIMLSVANKLYCYAECRYAGCFYDEYRGAFVTVSRFHHSLIFTSKPGSYPSGVFSIVRVRLFAFPEILNCVRNGWQ
jgi:hypothetical protein